MADRPTNETAVEYAIAAERLQLTAILFSLKGYNPKRKVVRGYAWTGTRWRRWSGPLPRAVHNRVFAIKPGAMRRVRGLAKELGPGFFNPPVSRDKWQLWQDLADNDLIRPHLPPTWPLSRRLIRRTPAIIRRYGCVILKPRVGSLGLGIVVVEPSEKRKGRYHLVPFKGRIRLVDRRRLRKFLRRLNAKRNSYLLQDTIPLITLAGRRCDIRVPVQRVGDGSWRVVTPSVKQAVRHRYITNIARGGQAYSFHTVIGEVFGFGQIAAIEASIAKLSLDIATHLSTKEPHLADLGLDVGLDPDGKPWLIEVNLRDQRLVSKAAGEMHIHAQLYHNPIAYADYILRTYGGSGKRGRG